MKVSGLFPLVDYRVLQHESNKKYFAHQAMMPRTLSLAMMSHYLYLAKLLCHLYLAMMSHVWQYYMLSRHLYLVTLSHYSYNKPQCVRLKPDNEGEWSRTDQEPCLHRHRWSCHHSARPVQSGVVQEHGKNCLAPSRIFTDRRHKPNQQNDKLFVDINMVTALSQDIGAPE